MTKLDLIALVRYSADVKATDLHVGINRPPQVRVSGTLVDVPRADTPSREELTAAIGGIRSTGGNAEDFVFDVDHQQCRAVTYASAAQVAITIRLVDQSVRHNARPTGGTIHKDRTGQLIVIGPTGCGKSTLLAEILSRRAN